MIKEGDILKNLIINFDDSTSLKLNELKESNFIFYFYPKDDTPGCTKEALAFNEKLSKINQLNFRVFGISKDSISKHLKFKAKYNLNFSLISDEDLKICKEFGVWVEKSMYGKKYMGIQRSSFLVVKGLKVIKIWRNVKVKGHVEEIIEFIEKI